MPFRCIFLLLFSTAAAWAQLTPQQKALNLESFETVWTTIRDRHPDKKLNGLDWQAVHDETKPLIERAQSMDEVRGILRAMVDRLNSSHYAIIRSERYAPAATEKPTDVSENAQPGRAVSFGNLPESRLIFESRVLPGGAGYIHFNEFLDPVSLMPEFEAAMKRFAKAPGIVLDLRGNPGGIGVMAMGIAGFFIDKPGQKLGEMKTGDTTLKFTIFPRAQAYRGKLAILVDGESASTTEILAQGMQDLKRARIFGSRTAAAALPSDIIRLPNGDRFQFAEASYTSVGGKVLEGAGVTPDVEVRAAAGRDAAIEAAEAWIAE